MVFPSHAGHVTMETVFGQAVALRLEKRDEHHPLESETTGLKMSRGTFTYTFSSFMAQWINCYTAAKILLTT